ncbi:hybrid sensor histidine kinase/response regulator [Calothrix sp. PCC 7507]|uniref:hybrid sensor histidine kinase/response regulator n=1 Tax=Calothrix sp. PCC 7507 TaxID=99598 RepID=UPI00029EFB9C|nr:hybrid sensor histidine kinase/response regulator [Calothrix sp. PCC 7507]AFY31704.1 CheA signal transduction histidine kinase [Calothrix sp. PCC 7507]
MNIDDEIRQQGYIYFLAEAPELLETIEKELFSLSSGFSIAKVHNLMRATHTLKGGASNVGLEAINTLAHSLEDVFKSLYNPDVVIDDELQTLILQAYECLRLAITAELTGSNINGQEIILRSTSVFAQLQEKLGDAFGTEAHIPTSEELGFDIVQSIFEVGVQQRIDSIAAAINNPLDNTELFNLLSSQAEVFIGLAESLNLPGFGAIAQTILAALTANPSQVKHIGEVALANLQQAKAAVLSGDRISGGEPSQDLKVLSIVSKNDVLDDPQSSNKNFDNTLLLSEIKGLYKFLTTTGNTKNQPLKPAKAKFYLKVIRYIFGWFNHQMQKPKSELNLALLISSPGENPINYIENWLMKFLDFIQEPTDSQSFCIYRQGIVLTIILTIVKFRYSTEKNDDGILVIKELQNSIIKLAKEYKKSPPVTSQEKNWIDNPKLQNLLVFQEISLDKSRQNSDGLLQVIWGGNPSLISDDGVGSIHTIKEGETEDFVNDIESLIISEQASTVMTSMTISVGQINQQIEQKTLDSPTKKSRQSSFVRVDIEGLQRLNYLSGELLIYQKRRTLHDEQIKEIIEQLTQQISRNQTTLNKLGDLPLQIQNIASPNTQKFDAVKFDALEMDVYTEFHMTLHEAIEETLQLQETTESLDLLLTQATQISEKKQKLILNIIDNLVEARMLPLGNILNRFSQMVTNLGNIYAKHVELKLIGTEVLVDKAIAEKLYEPLLHLVRNAFDHGIEPPQVRRELGKSEQGLIEICAYHQGSQTIIEVRDDGQGLDFERIRAKAIELNLIPANDEARGYSSHSTESELLDLMFSARFSTASQVSEISGRGMGLDIVRSQLQALDGSISVQSSPKQGTTFLLKIPFSMTTDKLMLVQAGGVVYALLLDSIERILIPSTQQVKEFENKKVLHWQTDAAESMIVLRQLSELLYYNSSFSGATNLQNIVNISDLGITNNPVILLRRNQEIFGLEVDQIIGEQELVIRPLGNGIAPPKYIYGCSSLANGTLILVIDASLLVESQEMQAVLETMGTSREYSANQQALPLPNLDLNPLPLLAPSAPTSTTQTQSSQLLPSKNKSPKVVLIVDDAISLRQTISLTLQKSSYQVLQAQNGVEALEQLQLHPEIQVVISDLEMPRMNGFELLSNIRQNPNFAKLPVVILTSRSAEKHRLLAQSLGATAYLTKPYLEDKFLSTVGNLINMN